MERPERIGPYLVERVLGAGAIGKVFLAKHPRMEREVAIKLLHGRDPELVARFRREAEVMARIRDERVVEVYEAGVHEGEPYLVMQFCPGRDLAEVLRERGALPPAEAARLVAEVARGVAAAHAVGVIHRDLKPANVIVDAALRPKVTDFGVAAARGARRQSLTETGVILGTPAYMAPEQASDSRSVDARSDVYALGAILYECLAGRRPFTGSTGLAVLAKVMEGKVEPLPPEVPLALAEIVTCALSLDPGDRFASATYLAEALDEASAEQATSGSGSSGLRALGVTGGLLGLAGLAYSLSGLGPQPTPTASPNLAASPTPAASPNLAASPTQMVSPSPAVEASPSPSPAAELPPCRRADYFAAKQRFRQLESSELLAAARGGHPAAMTELARRRSEARGAPGWPESAEWLERAARAGDLEAMVALSQCYAFGRGVARDRSQELAWLERAEGLGSYAAPLIRAKGLPPREGDSVRAAAWELARQDAELGDPAATIALLRESFVLGDLEGVRRWLGPGLALGLREALLIEGYLLRWEPEGDPARAAEAFRRAHELGDLEATCAWARCLLEGQGVAQEEGLGVALLDEIERWDPRGVRLERVRLLWRQGLVGRWFTELEALAQERPTQLLGHRWGDLGIHVMEATPALEEGQVERALNLQIRFLRRAAPARSLDGRIPYNLAIFRARQKGPTRDSDALFERSAILGHPRGARGHAIVLLRRGDMQEASRWLHRAGELGNLMAWRHLAALVQTGGVEGGAERICYYLWRAAELGDQEGQQALGAMLILRGFYLEAALLAERARSSGHVSGEIDLALIGVLRRSQSEEDLEHLEGLAETEPKANLALATLYATGDAVPKDERRAEGYARRARELQARRQ